MDELKWWLVFNQVWKDAPPAFVEFARKFQQDHEVDPNNLPRCMLIAWRAGLEEAAKVCEQQSRVQFGDMRDVCAAAIRRISTEE
jgi:hypothetical protein